MTTALDTTLVPKVLEIVNRLGKTVTIKDDATPGDYNPETGEFESGAAMTEYSKKVTPPADYSYYFPQGTTFAMGSVQVGLPASGLEFTPVIGMGVSFDSKEWRVTKLQPIYTGDEVALWILNLEGED